MLVVLMVLLDGRDGVGGASAGGASAGGAGREGGTVQAAMCLVHDHDVRPQNVLSFLFSSPPSSTSSFARQHLFRHPAFAHIISSLPPLLATSRRRMPPLI